MSHNAQDRLTTKIYPPPNFSCVKVEKSRFNDNFNTCLKKKKKKKKKPNPKVRGFYENIQLGDLP